MSQGVLAFVFTLAIGSLQTLWQPGLQGSVSGSTGAATMVVLYPAEPSAWTEQSRFHSASILPLRRFAFGRIAPGLYKIAVVNGTEPGSRWPSREFLEWLEPYAFQFRYTGAPETMDLVMETQNRISAVTRNGSTEAIPLPDALRRPAGVVSGQVIDAEGRPIEGAEVRVFRLSQIYGYPQLREVSLAVRTDARGAYRVNGVTPGEPVYIGVLSYASELDSQRQFRRLLPESVPQPDGSRLGYVATLYPNATSHKEAQPIVIIRDQELTMNITLARRIVVDIAGVLAPATGQVRIRLLPMDPADQIGAIARQVFTSPQGQFDFPDVPLGRYVIVSDDSRAPFRRPITVDGPIAPLVISAPAPLKGASRP